MHGFATRLALAAMNVELTNQRLARDFGLVLLDDVGFRDGAAAVGTGLGQRSLVALVDLLGRRRRAMAVWAVVVAGLASGCFGLFLGRAFREGSGLAFASPLALFEGAAE